MSDRPEIYDEKGSSNTASEQGEGKEISADDINSHEENTLQNADNAAESADTGAKNNRADIFEEASRAAEKYSDGAASSGYAPKHVAEKHGGAGKLSAGKIAAIVAGCIFVLLLGVMSWTVYGYDKVYKGVIVCGIDAGGLTEEQLCQAIAKYGQDLYEKKSIAFSINGQPVCEIEGSSVEAGINARESAKKAYAYGREGNFFARAASILKSASGGCAIDAAASINETQLAQIAEQTAAKAADIASENAYKIQDNILYLDTKNLGLKINSKDIADLLRERFETADFSKLDYNSEIFEPNAEEIERILNGLVSKKQNARLDLEKDPTGATIIPHSDGISFDLDAARKAFEESDERYVKIKVDYIQPDVTEQQLRDNLFRDELANVSTTLNANLKDRTTNVRLAAEFINGKILNPGDEFSYNDTVGPRTVERGFQNAKIFQNGDVVNGLGGGICQVSSTLYMATLYSNMQITERRNHNFAVAYTPVGQDATVSYGTTDFKFKNSSIYPIKILAEQKGSEIRIIIKGTKTDGNTVKLVTEILSKTPYKKVTINDESLAAGKTVVKNEGFTGYKSKTYRVILDQNGKEISRKLENNSSYAKLDKVVRVGTKGGSAAVSGTQPNIPTTASVPTTKAPTTSSSGATTAAPKTSAPTTSVPEQGGVIVFPATY